MAYPLSLSRRQWLGATAASITAGALAAPPATKCRVAVVMTTCFYRSHAHVILENFLNRYLFNGRPVEPAMDVVSFYVDQFPENDMARDIARVYGIAIYPSISQALCCGGDRLAADAVLSIGEHGKYPSTPKGQVMYPRKRFFDEIVEVFRRSRRSVPVFNDKHLSYRWDWAKEMVDTARTLRFPLMAGSSVPLAQRIPNLELPMGVELTDAVSIHGGGVESYDFHALEVLQSMVESRRGGESGVSQLRFMSHEQLWSAEGLQEWSPPLAQAAMRQELDDDHELVTCFDRGGLGRDGRPVPMHAIVLKYRDGFRGVALKVGNSGIRWNFACRRKDSGAVEATRFYVGPWDNRNLFKALSHAIQWHFWHRRAPYPVERTLLVSGVLDSAMDSRMAEGKWVKTPHLEWRYEPLDFRAMREMGATWRWIPEGTPQPSGLDRLELHWPPGQRVPASS